MTGRDSAGWRQVVFHPELSLASRASWEGFSIKLHFWLKSPLLCIYNGKWWYYCQCRLVLSLTFIVFDFVILTFFFLTFGCRQERIPSHVLGSGIKTHLFCSVVLFHTSLQIKTFCVLMTVLSLGYVLL